MKWNYSFVGIPENMFIGGNVPITKTEVRVLSLSKLMLKEDSKVLDIGCGTGSITVESALICKSGSVFAIDRSKEAVRLTKENIVSFEINNAQVVEGSAPFDLPVMEFDRVFVGGSGGNMDSVIKYAYKALTSFGVIVVNTILIDSTYKALSALESAGFINVSCTCVNVSRGVKVSGWMMKAQNPVYVISGEKEMG